MAIGVLGESMMFSDITTSIFFRRLDKRIEISSIDNLQISTTTLPQLNTENSSLATDFKEMFRSYDSQLRKLY